MTGWISPHWIAEDTLLRSDPGTILDDDAVFTQPGSKAATRGSGRQEGPRRKDVKLSRDQRVAVGIAGFNARSLRLPSADVPVRRSRLGPQAVHTRRTSTS